MFLPATKILSHHSEGVAMLPKQLTVETVAAQSFKMFLIICMHST